MQREALQQDFLPLCGSQPRPAQYLWVEWLREPPRALEKRCEKHQRVPSPPRTVGPKPGKPETASPAYEYKRRKPKSSHELERGEWATTAPNKSSNSNYGFTAH